MNECQECEQDGARDVRVTHTTGATETLKLCDRCVMQLENGGFVTEVVRTELTH